MAKFPQIPSILSLQGQTHGKTARAVVFAITIKTITPKTLTKAITKR